MWGPPQDLWGPLGTCGHLSVPMGTYGELCRPMGTYGDLWEPMGNYGEPWGTVWTSVVAHLTRHSNAPLVVRADSAFPLGDLRGAQHFGIFHGPKRAPTG